MQRRSRPRLRSFQSQSLSLSTNLDFLSQPIGTDTTPPTASTSTPTTPLPEKTPAHVRRKTFAGNLEDWSAVHDYEERIALLESQNSRISVELKATRDALVEEREDRRIDRQSLFISNPQIESDTHLHEQAEVLYERKLRMEILDSLKKVRAQNMTISRSLRESQDNYASLGSVLEAEQNEKQELREEIKRLSQKNFMLFEHNKLLASRDSALQEQISSLMTKSQADNWMRSVLEEELQNLRQSSPLKPVHENAQVARASTPAITLEHQGHLRAQLVAALDELHVARRCLEVSETRCEELDNRVSSLQREMTQCLDSSAQVLDVERGLRAEVEGYTHTLEEENARLKADIHNLQESRTEIGPAKRFSPRSNSPKTSANMEASFGRAAPPFYEPAIAHQAPDVQKITVDVRNVTLSPVADKGELGNLPQSDLKMRRRERLLERQLRLSSSKKIARRRSSVRLSRSALFASVASPTIIDVPVLQSVAQAPHPVSDLIVASPKSSSHRSVPSSSPAHAVEIAPRDPFVLKPLRLSVVASKRLSSYIFPPESTATVAPSPILPPVPLSTPEEPIPVRDKWRHRFRTISSSTTNYPDSPDSTVSTLVASSPTRTTANKEKSLILATTLSKKPSFDVSLKSSTTLFLDKRDEGRKAHLPSPTLTNNVQEFFPSPAHLRRASAVLASIAKSTGIGSLEDWFVV